MILLTQSNEQSKIFSLSAGSSEGILALAHPRNQLLSFSLSWLLTAPSSARVACSLSLLVFNCHPITLIWALTPSLPAPL